MCDGQEVTGLKERGWKGSGVILACKALVKKLPADGTFRVDTD